MRITTDNFRDHLDTLGYYEGAEFSCAEQVREYLLGANLDGLFGGPPRFTGRELARLADLAIEHEEHWEEV